MAGRLAGAFTMTPMMIHLRPAYTIARRILGGRLLGPGGAFTVSRNARVGLVTPRTQETITPDAGPQSDHRTPLPTLDERSSGNGRAPFALERDGAVSASGARRVGPVAVTVEALLYGLILVAAALTRFWDLGSRALHHDESLHAYFSWMLATGQ